MWVFPSPTDGTATSWIKSQSDFSSHCETWWQLTTFVCVCSRMFISILTLLHHMLTEHQVEMIVPGLRILLPFMKVFLYFYISFFCCSAESFSLQGNSSNYSVSRPAEGSRLPNTVCGQSAYSSAPLWPPGSVCFCCHNTSIILQTYYTTNLCCPSANSCQHMSHTVFRIWSNRKKKKVSLCTAFKGAYGLNNNAGKSNPPAPCSSPSFSALSLPRAWLCKYCNEATWEETCNPNTFPGLVQWLLGVAQTGSNTMSGILP